MIKSSFRKTGPGTSRSHGLTNLPNADRTRESYCPRAFVHSMLLPQTFFRIRPAPQRHVKLDGLCPRIFQASKFLAGDSPISKDLARSDGDHRDEPEKVSQRD